MIVASRRKAKPISGLVHIGCGRATAVPRDLGGVEFPQGAYCEPTVGLTFRSDVSNVVLQSSPRRSVSMGRYSLRCAPAAALRSVTPGIFCRQRTRAFRRATMRSRRMARISAIGARPLCAAASLARKSALIAASSLARPSRLPNSSAAVPEIPCPSLRNDRNPSSPPGSVRD